jgi:hypothetical protein
VRACAYLLMGEKTDAGDEESALNVEREPARWRGCVSTMSAIGSREPCANELSSGDGFDV